MKSFFVADQYGKRHNVVANSARMAVVVVLERYYGYANPKLFKVYQDGAEGSPDEGKVFHTGYGCGRFWFSVAEMTFLREEAHLS